MLELFTDGAEQVGGIVALALALFFLGRAIRSDARLNRSLEQRVASLERRLRREEDRRYKLEGLLRAAGLPVPAWTPQDGDDRGEPRTPPPPHHRKESIS